MANGMAQAHGNDLRVDPFTLPVRYQATLAGPASATTPAVYLDREQAIIKRRLGGIPTTLSTPVSAFRGVLMWAPTDRARVSAAYYLASENQKDGSSFNLPVGSFETGQSCYNTALAGPASTRSIACPADAVPGQTVNGVYTRPGFTYGPFDWLRPFQSLNSTRFRAKSITEVANLTFDYDFDRMSMKAITSDMRNGVGVSTVMTWLSADLRARVPARLVALSL